MLDGGDGDDVIDRSTSIDRFDGAIYGTNGDDEIIVRAGKGSVQVDGMMTRLKAGDYHTINGQGGDDTIIFLGADDMVKLAGGEGNDTLISNTDHSSLYGGTGDDVLIVTNGWSSIYGDAGYGDSGSDVVFHVASFHGMGMDTSDDEFHGVLSGTVETPGEQALTWFSYVHSARLGGQAEFAILITDLEDRLRLPLLYWTSPDAK